MQILGLTIYEIPIDSRIAKWLNTKLEFPLTVSAITLQDLNLGTYLKEGPLIFITNISSIEADPKTTGVFEGVKVSGFLVIVEHQIKTSKQSFSVPMTYSLVLRQKKEKEPLGLGFGIYHIKRLN